MLQSPHNHQWLPVAVLIFTASVLVAIEPPGEIIGKLSAEAYPERVAAEQELFEWASEGGDSARKWLLKEGRKSENPEVHQRSERVLKAVVIEELTRDRPGYVGVRMASVKLTEDGDYGVEIQEVNPGTPAELAGLKVNDVVLKLNGEAWTKPAADHEFGLRVGTMKGGDKIRLEVLRDGKEQVIELVLAPRPWSLGLYSQRRQFRADPFAARALPLLPTEDEAAEEAFRAWLREHSDD
ncbi:MAG: PDZ domain-containing protein [Verrucomicrobiota bacterium]